MLTVSGNRTGVRRIAGVGSVTQVIEKESELVASASSEHAIVLRFVYDAIGLHGEPIERAVLEWYADVADAKTRPPRIPAESFKAFTKTLGPRPRRNLLLSVLRDLVAMGYLSQTMQGFNKTKKGSRLLSQLTS
jgi:hypothetical protein